MYKVRELPRPKTTNMPNTIDLKPKPEEEEKMNQQTNVNTNSKNPPIYKSEDAALNTFLIGYAHEERPSSDGNKTAREAMLYAICPEPVKDGDVMAVLKNATFRLEIYDYRSTKIILHKKDHASDKTDTDSAPTDTVQAVVTSYEFDAYGRHTKGMSTMAKLLNVPAPQPQKHKYTLEKDLHRLQTGKVFFNASLSADRYTNGHSLASGIDNPREENVFALSIGGLSKTPKHYAVPLNNRLSHVFKDNKEYTTESEPIYFPSIIAANKNNFYKK